MELPPTAVDWNPGEANGNVRQVDCTTWNHFWWFCLDELGDKKLFKKRKKKKKGPEETEYEFQYK